MELWNAEGVYLIILQQSGVFYTNQVGGGACLHPEVEGILLPFNNDFLYGSSTENLYLQLSQLLENWMYLTNELANKVDILLAKYPETKCVSIDRTKLKKSMEAWVYVDIKENEHDTFRLFKGFGKTKGILTWPNSD